MCTYENEVTAMNILSPLVQWIPRYVSTLFILVSSDASNRTSVDFIMLLLLTRNQVLGNSFIQEQMLGFSFYWKSKWGIFVNAVANFIWKANNKDKIICFCDKYTNFDEAWCQHKAIALLNFKHVNPWFGTHIIHNYTQRSCCSCVLCCFSCVWLCVTQWTVTLQASLSIGILQRRILEWVAMPSSRGSSQPRDQTHVSYVFCFVR